MQPSSSKERGRGLFAVRESYHVQADIRGIACECSKDMKGTYFVMERIRTVEVGTRIGERVRVAGWLHSLRRLGGISFLVVRDGWGIIQAVAETEVELGPLQDGSIGLESIVAVEGVVVGESGLGFVGPGGSQTLTRDPLGVDAPTAVLRCPIGRR